MLNRVKTLSALGAVVILLSACLEPVEPSEADIVRALPAYSFTSALSVFESVCQNGNADPNNPALIFKTKVLDDGREVCEMRGRAPGGNSEAYAILEQRYGRQRSNSRGLSSFDAYPNGPLFVTVGYQNRADAGTYIIGIVR